MAGQTRWCLWAPQRIGGCAGRRCASAKGCPLSSTARPQRRCFTARCAAWRSRCLRAAGGASAWASALHLHEGRPWRGWTEGSLLGALTPLHLVALCGDAASIRQAVAAPGAAALLTQRTGGVLGGANRLTALELVIDLYSGLPVRWRLHKGGWCCWQR